MLLELPDDMLHLLVNYVSSPGQLAQTCRLFADKVKKRTSKISDFLITLQHAKWLNSQSISWTVMADIAVKENNVKFISRIAYKCPPNLDKLAATKGHLDMLRMLVSYGASPNKMTFSLAVSNGHMHIVLWLYDLKCCWDQQACIKIAHEKGHVLLCDWLTNHSPPIDDPFDGLYG